MNERPKDLENRKTVNSCTMAPMQLPRTLDCRIKRVIGLVDMDGRTHFFVWRRRGVCRADCLPDSRPEQLRTPKSCRGKKGLSTAFCSGPSKEVARAGGRQGLAKGCARSPTRVTQLLSILAGPPSQRRRPPRRPRWPKCCPCPPCRCSLSPLIQKKVSFCALLPSLFLFTRL